MIWKSAKLFFVILAVLTVTRVYAGDWVQIKGNVKTKDGAMLCVMVLANGQHMFTCDPLGEYSLYVPMDDNGQITLFAFCDGMMPFKTVLGGSQSKFDITMSPCSCENPETETCENIKGNWYAYTTGNMTMTMSGKTETSPISGFRTVSVTQTGCNTEWNFSDSGYTYKRTGNIEGNTVYVTGECTNGTEFSDNIEEGLKAEGLYGAEVKIATNTHTGEGTVSGEKITYSGSGNISGTITYMSIPLSFSVVLTENSAMTKTSVSRSSMSEYGPAELFSVTDIVTEFLKEIVISEINH